MGKSLAEKEEQNARESRLQLAVENDNVDELHNLIVEEPELLDRISKRPFPNTPLHIAAAFGKTNVAMELAILRPSFTRKLNPEGYSPMHLALQHERYHTVKALVTFNPKLIRVQGRCGITPLHFVAGKEGGNELELLAEFLDACRSSIKDLTSRGETAIHIAIKNYNLKALNFLFGWLTRHNRTEILGWKDQDGNTFSQIALRKEQLEIIDLLIAYKTAFLRGPLSIKDNEDEDIYPSLFSRQLTASEKFAILAFQKCANFFRPQNEATREVILVVSTLIVAATYQATLTPPEGYWQDSSLNHTANFTVVTANSSSIAVGKPHRAGDNILSGWRLYSYLICNSMAFYASIATILATTLPLEATSIVYISIPFLCTAYLISLLIQIPISNAAAEISVVVLFEFSLLTALCLLLYMKIIKHRRGLQTIGRPRRLIPTFLKRKDQK